MEDKYNSQYFETGPIIDNNVLKCLKVENKINEQDPIISKINDDIIGINAIIGNGIDSIGGE